MTRIIEREGISVLWRIQGGINNNLQGFYKVGNRRLIALEEQDDIDNYVYLSKTEEHSKLFLYKKIINVLKIFFKQNGIDFNKNNVVSVDCYNQMRLLLDELNDDDILFEQISFYVPTMYVSQILEDVSVSNKVKRAGQHYNERVDVRKAGGGFGLTPEWMRLTRNLAIFSTRIKITKNDIVDFLHQYRIMLITQHKRDIVGELLASKTPEVYVNKEYAGNILTNNIEQILKNARRDFSCIIKSRIFPEGSSFAMDPVFYKSELFEQYRFLARELLPEIIRNRNR